MGYPPRKKDDTSFGDAYNWEWIIDVGLRNTANIIIVSRDSDYGLSYDNKLLINDWLSQEFKERVSKKRSITLTDKLSVAFKALSVTVSKDMIKEEEEFINQRKKEESQIAPESKQMQDIFDLINQKSV